MDTEAMSGAVIDLLSEHDLHVSDAEVPELVPGYRAMRATAALLRAVESGSEEIALTFNPSGMSS